ncbi:hypothetical protein DW1_0699 [Proteiniborus sp. DW1]|uniref:DUF885 family protein n=1 Tax=Proteiniborus sp. DW1 TaxID=1889883 RepID=UPI00092E13F8|nr:DUF885 family protein [Proteiniborus sp. DW1]SCG82308.1 hypothetical protein DW1_0699 [Proteiniborus sp. DW1]
MQYLIFSLQSELYRAVRLVVDTGIHYKGWTREEAIKYYNENTRISGVNEVDRMIVWPGQACAYKIGEIELLRHKAMAELGDSFDIKELHDVILMDGNMPLKILEKQVDEYILYKK